MSKQNSLFEGSPSHPASIRLSGGYRRPLTPAQRTFNRLVARVENLRLKLGRETAELNDALIYYSQNLEPRLRRMAHLRKDIVRTLEPFLKHPGLRKSEKKILRTIMAEQFEDIAATEGGLHDNELRALFARVTGVDFETAQEERFEDTRNRMECAFEEMGLDIDLSGFSPDMNYEDFAAQTAEIADKIALHTEERERTSRKSKKQLEREERERQAEEVRKKSIASIYKQLARVLHPDFETDPEAKPRKEKLMQELTVAYHENDLHTLLRLELEWIQHEQNNVDRLTEEKLIIYNQALKDQVRELEHELEELPLHPRYQVLQVPDGPFGIRLRRNGPHEAQIMDSVMSSMESDLQRFRCSDALAVVQSLVREFRRATPY
jgi:hypothetical protein